MHKPDFFKGYILPQILHAFQLNIDACQGLANIAGVTKAITATIGTDRVVRTALLDALGEMVPESASHIVCLDADAVVGQLLAKYTGKTLIVQSFNLHETYPGGAPFKPDRNLPVALFKLVAHSADDMKDFRDCGRNAFKIITDVICVDYNFPETAPHLTFPGALAPTFTTLEEVVNAAVWLGKITVEKSAEILAWADRNGQSLVATEEETKEVNQHPVG